MRTSRVLCAGGCVFLCAPILLFFGVGWWRDFNALILCAFACIGLVYAIVIFCMAYHAITGKDILI